MNKYRQRVKGYIHQMLDQISTPSSALDFGAGDGWFANEISNILPKTVITAVDVKSREVTYFDSLLLDPTAPLPFPDESFDLVYSVDVLHHCPDPAVALKELIRVSSRYLIIKDHVAFGFKDLLLLGVLDEIGNRKFGIPSPYHYQKNWEWEATLNNHGWICTKKKYPAHCNSGIIGRWTNHLQYVALYEKMSE